MCHDAFLCAPAGVGPLEVRFAHPVRLSPATHSQGHGRPCLQRSHPRRGFCCHVAEAWNEDGMEEGGGDGVKGKRKQIPGDLSCGVTARNW